MGCCVAVAVADLAQVLLLGKGAGAIGGLVLYATYARGLQQHSRWTPWAVLLMPIVPLAVISGLLGPEISALVDGPMIAVAVVQIAASACAAGVLRDEWANRGTTR